MRNEFKKMYKKGHILHSRYYISKINPIDRVYDSYTNQIITHSQLLNRLEKIK